MPTELPGHIRESQECATVDARRHERSGGRHVRQAWRWALTDIIDQFPQRAIVSPCRRQCVRRRYVPTRCLTVALGMGMVTPSLITKGSPEV